MFDGSPIDFGAELFWWIVCIGIGLVTALTVLDFKTLISPEPYEEPEDHSEYWTSRKHEEDVHREFPKDDRPSPGSDAPLRG